MVIISDLIDIIHEHLGIEKERIMPDSCFDKDYNLGPEEISEFLRLLEKHYQINFSSAETTEIKTVADLNDSIRDHLNEI